MTTKQAEQLPNVDDGELPPPLQVRPILKWAGGKSWIVPRVAPGIWRKLQSSRGRYIEPFLGGGALALHLGLSNMIVNDALSPLMEFYRTVVSQPGAVAWALSALAIPGVDEVSYYRVRDMRPAAPAVRAARFLYLNKLGYNGLYRENKKGEFNVPYGDQAYRSSSVNKRARDAMGGLFPNKAMIHRVADAFSTSSLRRDDFANVIFEAARGDVVYCDPPYDGAYASYTADQFGAEDQKRLGIALRAAHDRGATILATNADTPFIRSIYEDWTTISITQEKRSINSDGGGRRRVPCVLVTNDMGIVGT